MTDRQGGYFRALAGALPMVAALAACAAQFEAVDGYDGEYVESVPPGIEVYPRYEFRDGYAYYVDGRWYHRHGGRWVRYRAAPPELERRRFGEHRPEHR